jgi:aspartate/methionine/tyrosine aminotransferase
MSVDGENFSVRTNWEREHNRLTALLEKKRAAGEKVIDLTVSNPTACGIEYPAEEILAAISMAEALNYNPGPRGILSAREAVAQYYMKRQGGRVVDPSDIFLTASTSEGYSHLFKLLCNAGDEVLVPSPSYPLFDFLAQVNDVSVKQYKLTYDGEWQIRIDSLRESITSRTRAIVLINPHNPTGMFVKPDEMAQLTEIAEKHSLAIITDEVFAEFGFGTQSVLQPERVLSFTLNGISKMIGLPQMKLGWIVVEGPTALREEACARLEILCDTFLLVNTPVQLALPELLRIGMVTRDSILKRTHANYEHLKSLGGKNSVCSLLNSEAGWYGILRVPSIKSDEEWCLELLETKGVYVYPGYFFDMEAGPYLLVSLLVEEVEFGVGVFEILRSATPKESLK